MFLLRFIHIPLSASCPPPLSGHTRQPADGQEDAVEEGREVERKKDRQRGKTKGAQSGSLRFGEFILNWDLHILFVSISLNSPDTDVLESRSSIAALYGGGGISVGEEKKHFSG